MTSQALDNRWPAQATDRFSEALVGEHARGTDPEKLALLLVIGMEQDLTTAGVDTTVGRAVRLARSETDPRYGLYRTSVDSGLAVAMAREIYYIALSEDWPEPWLALVFEGILNAQKAGLTPEKVATAIIVRLEQEPSVDDIGKLVQEEVEFVRSLEVERIAEIESDTLLAQAYASPDLWSNSVYEAPVPEESAVEPPSPPESARDTTVTLKADTSSAINVAIVLPPITHRMIERSIADFMGTPYKWGGTSKKRGTDCSGFTQGVFRDGGVRIPRVSRVQYAKTPFKLKARDELDWGALVFFNKSGGPDR